MFPKIPSSPVTKKIINSDACKSPDKSSAARQLFSETHKSAEFKIYATDEEAVGLFQKLPSALLPELPIGHQWAIPKPGESPSIIKDENAKDHDIEVVVFGPDQQKINYLALIDGITTQSFSHTKKSSGPKRRYPMTIKDYTVQGYHYNDSKSHIRGHCIDHQDTMLVGGSEHYSTYDPRNYIPEPDYKYWGLTMRRLLAKSARDNGNAYMQFAHYADDPCVTINGTAVPDYLYFYPVAVDKNQVYAQRYSLGDVYNIDYGLNYAAKKPANKTVLNFCQDFTTSLESAPVVKLYDASATDRAMRLESRDLRKRVTSIDTKAIKALNSSRDAFFAQRKCADREYGSINRKLEFTVRAAELSEIKAARQTLKMANDSGQKLLDLDDKRKIIGKDQMESLEKSMHNLKMDGKEESDMDSLRQICKDQRSVT